MNERPAYADALAREWTTWTGFSALDVHVAHQGVPSDREDRAPFAHPADAGVLHPVCITRFPSFRTQTLENFSRYQ